MDLSYIEQIPCQLIDLIIILFLIMNFQITKNRTCVRFIGNHLQK